MGIKIDFGNCPREGAIMQPGSEASATSSATATPPGVPGRPGVAAPPRVAGRPGVAGRKNVAAPPDAAGRPAGATPLGVAAPPDAAGRPAGAAPPGGAGRPDVAAPPDATGRPGAAGLPSVAGCQHVAGSPDVAGPLRTAVSASLAGTASAPGSARKMRPRLLAELILLGVGYALYTLTRDLAPARRQMAFADAAAIRTAEGWLHIAGEQQANLWLTMHPVLATMADYYYATAHFVAVIAMLVWLYWRHPALYRRARAVLVAATLAAIAVIVTTANHYWLDAVGGLVILLTAAGIVLAASPVLAGDRARTAGWAGQIGRSSRVWAIQLIHVVWACCQAAQMWPTLPGYCMTTQRPAGSTREAHAHGCARMR